MNCLIVPLGKFGDHDKGYFGCLWCEIQKKCMKKNPHKGKSLIMKSKTKVVKRKLRKLKRVK